MSMGDTLRSILTRVVAYVALAIAIGLLILAGATVYELMCVLAAFAEFERSMILARTDEGRKRAQARGVRFRRKLKLSSFQIAEAIARRATGARAAE
jgi:DNA invertase Pin-like site-specific DNA recombinase